MSWALVILMWSASGGVSTSSVEFNSEVQCNLARLAVTVNAPLSIEGGVTVTVKALCLPLGTPK